MLSLKAHIQDHGQIFEDQRQHDGHHENPNDISVMRLIQPSTGRTVLKIEYTIQANMIIITENRIALTSIENFSRTLVK